MPQVQGKSESFSGCREMRAGRNRYRMRSFRQWFEMHHAYPEPDWDTKFEPLKAGDTIRVFHGFNDFRDAYRAVIYGLSGRYRADRRYSYEGDNNPFGLFVTLSLKKASEFTSPVEDEAIIEFNANENDLEAPVWPGGGYTVQGQMAQYFGHGRKGKLKRKDRRKVAQGEVENFLKKHPNDFHHVRNSDDRHKANILLNSTEYQALFIGDLNPQDVIAVHIRPKGSPYKSPFVRMSREEFLDHYKDYKDEPPSWMQHTYNWPRPPKERIFLPAEEFDADKFLQGIKSRYRWAKDPDEMLSGVWDTIKGSQDPRDSFIDTFQHLLWPKQYAKAMWFLKQRFK